MVWVGAWWLECEQQSVDRTSNRFPSRFSASGLDVFPVSKFNVPEFIYDFVRELLNVSVVENKFKQASIVNNSPALKKSIQHSKAQGPSNFRYDNARLQVDFCVPWSKSQE